MYFGDIREFDSNLELIKKLQVTDILVYKVRKDSNFFIFKSGYILNSESELRLLEEIKVLEASKGEIKGLPKLITKYKSFSSFSNPILKNFLPGVTLESCFSEIKPETQSKLWKTISELHYMGFVGFDLQKKNIIVSSNRENISLIDLGLAKHFSWVSKRLPNYNVKKDKDIREFEKLFN